MHTLHKGFTLIELLVVIAIIGILSAVVLASLNSARSKGKDAAAEQALEGARTQAELYFYANGNSYYNGAAGNGVCGQTAVNSVKTIGAQVQSAAQAEGYSYANATRLSGDWTNHGINGTSNKVACNDAATTWAAAIYLSTGAMFCVDSSGLATTTTNFGQMTGGTDTDCS
jgi:prepilin-type N-terminal cleavage/methylation domain-containing protein